jgi:hypothetical protein
MHHKLTKHGRFCKQNNQLPTKTHVELKDNSIVQKIFKYPKQSLHTLQNKDVHTFNVMILVALQMPVLYQS